MTTSVQTAERFGNVTRIIEAYLSRNEVTKNEIKDTVSVLTQAYLDTENTIRGGQATATEMPAEQDDNKVVPFAPKSDTKQVGLSRKPAVAVEESVHPDYIVCLLDGKQFKSMRSHLRKTYGMSPADYIAHFNLPSDYPIVAPNYSKMRSELAIKNGLGRANTPAPTPEQAPKAKRAYNRKASAKTSAK